METDYEMVTIIIGLVRFTVVRTHEPLLQLIKDFRY